MLLSANIFQPLIDVFAAVLKFFHNDIGVSWGFAIVLLTVAVRLALVPLGMRQFHSMQRMAQHMPEMKRIREKYKDNPQRQNQEMMSFYKENSINPLASCLPLAIQWPFLIGLFWTLRGNLRLDICGVKEKAYQLHYATLHHLTVAKAAGQTEACGSGHGASFLFIHDLTNNPKGVELVILLVLYVATSISSSMIMMMPGTEPSQRRLMLILPAFFAIVTIRFPAGALLYYIIFNLWMIVQQTVFKQLIGQQYRHPPGVALGVAGVEGSISSGGGWRGLLGLPSKVDTSPTDGLDGDRGTVAPEPPSSASRTGGATRTARTPARSSRPRSSAAKAESAPAPATEPRERGSNPPPSPRKKKKRSGRRR